MTICNDRPEPGTDAMPGAGVMSGADVVPVDDGPPTRSPVPTGAVADEAGSLVTEYGLLAVVAATVCGVVIQWASGGAIVRLFNALLNTARDLVGA